MIAALMFGEMLLKITELSHPVDSLCYAVTTMLSPLKVTDDMATTATVQDFSQQRLIFRLVRQVDFDKFEYQYQHTERDNSFAFQMQGRVEILEEPSGKANLDVLKAKVKKGGKLKKLLTGYYNS